MSAKQFGTRFVAWSAASDASLLTALLAHSGAAWRELLRRCGASIKRRVSFLLGGYGARRRSSDSHQEILAEFYLSLLENDMKKLRAYDAEKGQSLGAWLVLLAERHTHNHFRALAVRAMAALDEEHLAAGHQRQAAKWCAPTTEDSAFAAEVDALGLRLDEVV